MSSRFIVSKRQRFRLCDSTASVCHGGMLGAGASRPAPRLSHAEQARIAERRRCWRYGSIRLLTGRRQVTNEAGAASRHTRVQCLVGCGNSPVREFDGTSAWHRSGAHHTRSLPRGSCSTAMSARCRTIHARYFAMTSSREPSWPITNGCPICWGDRRKRDPAPGACRPVWH